MLRAGMYGLGALAVLFLLAPILGLALRTPWGQLGQLLSHPTFSSALRISLIASTCSVVLSAVLGVPLAWVLARSEFPGKRLVRALATLPMVMPPVVGGVALLLAFGRRGVFGKPLADATGITLPFTLAGVVVAATFVSMPFLVLAAEAGLRSADRRLEEAAATLGARPGYAFRRITLPLVAPALVAGLAMCWTRALGEFGATITFAGNLPGRTQTMPLAVYLALESNSELAYLLSFVLLAIAAIVIAALRGRAPAAP